MYSALFQQLLKTNATHLSRPWCLTPNLRLALHLQRAYAHDLQNSTQHTRVQVTPAICPQSLWLDSLWQQLAISEPKPVCLSVQQEQALWLECLRQAGSEHSYQELQQHAILAQSAFKTLCAWNLNLAQIEDHSQHLGFAYLQRAAQYFNQSCQRHNWIAPCQQLSHMTNYLQRAQHDAHFLLSRDPLAPIILLNFDEETPQQAEFWQSYRAHSTVQRQQIAPSNIKRQLTAYHDSQHELEAMASWAQNYHTQHPEQHIACVVPNIKQMRNQVESVFLKYFQPIPQPAAQQPQPAQPAFNLSLGRPLSEYTIIHVALQTLAIDQLATDTGALHKLWQSPYLQRHSHERYIAAQAQQVLSALPTLALQHNALHTLLNSIAQANHKQANAENSHPETQTPDATLAWYQRWQQFLQQLPADNEQRTRQEWCQYALHQLKQLSWPGHRRLNSQDHQVMQAFYQCLHNYSASDFVSTSIDYATFCQDLAHACRQHIFQAQTPTPAKIDILGALEAAGSSYAAIWISDLHAEQWPAAPQPHPFLPADLQRKHGMPHASAERELEVNQRLLARLAHASPLVHMSYAHQHQDKPQSASVLLTQWWSDIHPVACQAQIIDHPLEILQTQATRQNYVDEQAPCIAATELLAGGSGLLKSQAQCAFQGFSDYRLHIQPLKIPTYGINALDRGIITHRALQLLWENLQSQDDLLQQSANSLQRLLTSVSEHALNEFAQQQPYVPDILIKLEHQRLVPLLVRWCQIEAQRPAFRVVACEQTEIIKIDNVEFKVRLDRIDCDESGQYYLIDYKTGRVNWQHWFGTRLREPQLPLYSLGGKYALTGICYATLRSDQPRYEGISCDSAAGPFVKTLQQRQAYSRETLPADWSACNKYWRAQLQSTLYDFSQGEAASAPIHAEVCQHCELQPFCRIKHHATTR